jgi:cysteinyl-tRNA synthetase
MNVTDVGHLLSNADTGEDKMLTAARRMDVSAWEIAELYTQAFKDDLQRLNILEPHVWCRATDHIEEQIDAIRQIEEKGFAYRTSDGIYFDTSKLSNYGHLARLHIEGLREGARVDMGEKRLSTDFALWKFSPEGQQRHMEWESPWGKGFPGWHIECSAMSAKYLGELFDIHCGGQDHIPIHHTNEIAQAEVCYGTRLANYWLHGSFLQADDQKMAKSSGDFLTVTALMERGYDPLAYRYLCLAAHYRSNLSFSWESLDGAATALDRLRRVSVGWVAAQNSDDDYDSRFSDFVNDDLNTARAIALTWKLIQSDLPSDVKKATLLNYDKVFGLRLAEWRPEEALIPGNVRVL